MSDRTLAQRQRLARTKYERTSRSQRPNSGRRPAPASTTASDHGDSVPPAASGADAIAGATDPTSTPGGDESPSVATPGRRRPTGTTPRAGAPEEMAEAI